MQTHPSAPPRFVAVKELCQRTTLCRASIYKLIAQHEIKPPVKILGGRRVGWPADYVDGWISERMNAGAAQ